MAFRALDVHFVQILRDFCVGFMWKRCIPKSGGYGLLSFAQGVEGTAAYESNGRPRWGRPRHSVSAVQLLGCQGSLSTHRFGSLVGQRPNVLAPTTLVANVVLHVSTRWGNGVGCRMVVVSVAPAPVHCTSAVCAVHVVQKVVCIDAISHFPHHFPDLMLSISYSFFPLHNGRCFGRFLSGGLRHL